MAWGSELVGAPSRIKHTGEVAALLTVFSSHIVLILYLTPCARHVEPRPIRSKPLDLTSSVPSSWSAASVRNSRILTIQRCDKCWKQDWKSEALVDGRVSSPYRLSTASDAVRCSRPIQPFDVTPVIGGEHVNVNVAEWIRPPIRLSGSEKSPSPLRLPISETEPSADSYGSLSTRDRFRTRSQAKPHQSHQNAQ